MDIEERARLAVARVPSPGLFSTLFGRHLMPTLVVVLAGVAYGVWWTLQRGHSLGPTSLLVLLVVCVVALVVVTRQLTSALRTRKVADILLAGDLEGAARGYGDLLDTSLLSPAWRALVALNLAIVALVAGHAERAVVLARAVEASGSLQRAYDSKLKEVLILAMLALGRPAEARTLLAALLAERVASPGVEGHIGVELLVEALSGTPAAATEVAERFGEATRKPVMVALASTPVGAMQRAFGWLVVAYVWDRVARAASEAERVDAEGRRAAALLLAGRVQPFTYRYLAKAWPDLGAFAEGASTP